MNTEVKKLELGFFSKLFVTLIGLASTLSVTLWGAYAVLDSRMDSKVEVGKKEVYHVIDILKDERNQKIKAIDEKTSFQLTVMNNTLTEVQKDIKAVLRYSREAAVVKGRASDDELRADVKRPVEKL